MSDESVAENSAREVRDEAADNFYKVASMATGTLALLDEHGGAGDDDQLLRVWHSLRAVIDMANAYGEKITG